MPEKRILMIGLFFACLTLGGCSWYFVEPEENTQTEQSVLPEPPLVVQAAELTPGQMDNTLLAPMDYDSKNQALHDALTELIEALKTNNLEEAGILLHGLDEKTVAVTLEELQQEVEILHPVAWQVDNYRPAGGDGALVTVSFVWSDGTTRQLQPFSMLNLEGQWSVHFNSFAASFHTVARHMIKDRHQTEDLSSK